MMVNGKMAFIMAKEQKSKLISKGMRENGRMGMSMAKE